MGSPRVLELRIGSPAAGGHCVAHDDGSTIFVRGSLPGELVRAQVTGTGRGGRILFATVIEVLEPSSHRVVPRCGLAAVCGGCDLQHVDLDYQRRWKAEVLVDQLRRIGGLERIGGVGLTEAVHVLAADDADGQGWRTRVSVAVAGGQAGFHGARSSEVVPVRHCPISHPELAGVFAASWPEQVARVEASVGDPGGFRAVTAEGELLNDPAEVVGLSQRNWVRREAVGRSWRVATEGFWQAHPVAPDLLAEAVVTSLAPTSGEVAWDLYCGVGLFAGAVAPEVALVHAVEGDAQAIRHARRNLHDLPGVRLHQQGVADWLGAAPPGTDLVILDPPRAGAGREVVAGIDASGARATAYVACDGAALARDLKTFATLGWSVSSLTAFDLFPMTRHVEAVALLERSRP